MTKTITRKSRERLEQKVYKAFVALDKPGAQKTAIENAVGKEYKISPRTVHRIVKRMQIVS